MKKAEEGMALYRKYRPQKFSEVLGQEHIVSVLEGSVKLGRISHAYLFAGSRGTGKTSVARIFARAIETAPEDIYEMDAASNTGVEDIRSLNESVPVLPFRSKFKVYIIDEVHMLSKSAFNALLKTLEEPPAHVIFILATTDPDKLPETVVSRCQTFMFKRPTTKVLRDAVISVAKKEGFTLAPSSADLIALLGDGSFRDSFGIVQKVISSSSDKTISVEEVEKVVGAPRSALVDEFVNALHERNTERLLMTVASLSRDNTDVEVFTKLILRRMRFVLLLRFAPSSGDIVSAETSPEEFASLKTLASAPESGISEHALLACITALDAMRRTQIPELQLELAVLKLFNSNSTTS